MRVLTILKLNRLGRRLTLLLSVLIPILGIWWVARVVPLEKIRLIAQREISKATQCPIQIGAMGGDGITHLAIFDTRLGDPRSFGTGVMATVPSLVIRYSLLKMALKQDVGAGAYRIDVQNPVVTVHRNQADLWNVLSIVMPKGTSGQLPTFRGRVYVTNMTIQYRDDHGWGPRLTRFDTRLTRFNGMLDFSNPRSVRVVGTGRLQQGTVAVNGSFDLKTGANAWVIRVAQFDLSEWGGYVLKGTPIRLTTGRGDATLSIRNNDAPGLPIRVQIDATVNGASIGLTPFKAPIQQASGTVMLTTARVSPTLLTGVLGGGAPLATTVHSWLIANQWLDSSNRVIRSSLRTDDLRQLPLSLSQRQQLIKVLRSPPSHLYFWLENGRLGESVVRGKGALSLDHQRIQLMLTSPQFSFASLAGLFPQLKGWPVTLKGPAVFYMSGWTHRPILQGEIKRGRGALAGMPFDSSIWFQYANQELQLKSGETHLYGAPAMYQAKIGFSSTPTATIQVALSQMPLTKWGIKGDVSLNATLSGPVSQLAISLWGNTNAVVRGQQLSKLGLQGWLLNGNQLRIDTGSVVMNQGASPIRLMGLLQPSGWRLLIQGDQQPILTSRVSPPGMLTARVLLDVPSQAFRHPQPLSQATVTFNAQIQDVSVASDYLDWVEVAGVYRPNEWRIEHARVVSGLGSLVIRGTFEGVLPTQLSVQATWFKMNHDSWVQQWLPASVKPCKGVISGEVTMQRMAVHGDWWQAMMGSGILSIQDGMLMGQPLNYAMMKADWEQGNIRLSEGVFQTNRSTLNLHGSINNKGVLNIHLLSPTMDLSEWVLPEEWIPPLRGVGSLIGHIDGAMNSPNMTVTVNIGGLQVGEVSIHSLRGTFSYANHYYRAEGLQIQPQSGLITLDGYLKINPVRLVDSDFDFSIRVAPMQLAEMAVLVRGIQKEWAQKNQGQQVGVVMTEWGTPLSPSFVLDDTAFGTNRLLYTSGASTHSVGYYQSVVNRYQALTPKAESNFGGGFSGDIQGYFRAKSRGSQLPDIQARFQLAGFELGSVSGESGDILVQSTDRDTNYQLYIQNGVIGSGMVDELRVKGFYDQAGYLHIQSAQLGRNGEQHNIITGKFPLSAYWNTLDRQNPIDLRIHWVGSDIGVLTLLIPHLAMINNQGEIKLSVSGVLDAPVFESSVVVLKNAVFKLDESSIPLSSEVHIENGSIKIENNRILIRDIQLKWQGKDTQKLMSNAYEVNRVQLNGVVAFPDMSLRRVNAVNMDLDLRVNDVNLAIHFPGIYRGMVSLQSVSVVGVYAIPLSAYQRSTALALVGTDQEKGPIISGGLTLYDAEISLPNLEEKPIKPSFLIQLAGNLGQNVRLVGGLIGKGLLGNVANQFDLRLAPTPTPLQINGSLNAPKIQNSVLISGGTIDLLTRRFELLSVERQRIYNKTSNDPTLPNTVSFQSDYVGTKRKLIPMIRVAALTLIEPISSVVVTSSVTASIGVESVPQYTHVVIGIDGAVYDVNGFVFQQFTSPKLDGSQLTYKGTYQLGSGSVGNNDAVMIATILAPELVANVQAGNVQSSGLIRQLGSGTINTFLSQTMLKGIEKEIAKGTGLDLFMIDYNIGKALIDSSSTQTVGFNMMKSLFSNKLFIRARTDLDVERRRYVDVFQLSEVELTYFLDQNFSLNYANFMDDGGKNRNRYHLKYSYAY